MRDRLVLVTIVAVLICIGMLIGIRRGRVLESRAEQIPRPSNAPNHMVLTDNIFVSTHNQFPAKPEVRLQGKVLPLEDVTIRDTETGHMWFFGKEEPVDARIGDRWQSCLKTGDRSYYCPGGTEVEWKGK